jgi:(p)ppGpp synthase/HD superfamily hydrolase
MSASTVGPVLAALAYAAEKHRDQRRKGAGSPPAINHSIEVAELLARVAGVTDAATLQAAVLHDVLEDTDATAEELEAAFGPEVRRIVEEVTDDRELEQTEQRRIQVERAPHLSRAAKLVRLADKIANVRSLTHGPPADWSADRRWDYLEWTERVSQGCRGCSPELERLYERVIREGKAALRAEAC